MTRSRAFVQGTLTLLFTCISAAAAAPLNILLTNDDGYAAPGIQILRNALVAAGHNAVIVAPRTNQSGKGTGVADAGAMLNLQFHPAENAWSVNGTPSDTVRVALEVLKLRPDLVISGVNFGENLSVFANSSGTVSASVWALNSGYPAMAVSAGLNFAEAGLTPPFPSTLVAQESAAQWVVRLLGVLTAARHSGQLLLPDGIGLNINYPAVPNPRPAVLTELSHGYNTYAVPLKPDVDFATTGNIVVDLTFLPAPANPDRKNDAEMFAAGYITVSPIAGDWTGSAASLHAVLQSIGRLAEIGGGEQVRARQVRLHN
jgi:5'/3'-nucleotidase SurE